MKKQIMYLLSRTPVHVGAGNSVGVVDAPIMRERHTKTPIIPGSSLKGVCADLWNDDNYNRKEDGKEIFGDNSSENSGAGNILIGEARVLAFPVRSAKGSFAWITSPHALKKFVRDTDIKFDFNQLPKISDTQCFCSPEVEFSDKHAVILEEYKFDSLGNCKSVAEKIASLCDDEIWQTIVDRLVIVNDEMFSYFVEQSCEVVTRIKVDDETGVVSSGALFSQEQLPSETFFYSVITEFRDNGYLSKFSERIKQEKLLQIGGDASIGLGFCSVNFSEVL